MKEIFGQWNTKKAAFWTAEKKICKFAYLSALCADADIDIERSVHDADSTDATIRKTVTVSGEEIRSTVQLQLKCTSSKHKFRTSGNEIIYDLPVKNYNDLRIKSVPILLMLLVLPDDEKIIRWTINELLLKGTMYYHNLMGSGPVGNTAAIAVHFSKSDVVNQDSLLRLLRSAAKGELYKNFR